MRFLLYNIRYGTGIGCRFHLPVPYAGFFKRTTVNYDRIIEFIREVSPDIVGLVEVDSGSFRTRNNCQADSLACQLGFNHIVESKYLEGSLAKRVPVLANQGNALLTRQDILEHRFHFFRHGMKRLVIEVQTAEATILLVHLSLAYRHRHYQLRQLYKMIQQARGKKPIIVAGDFNVLWGDRELDLFLAASGLSSANSDGHPSHPSHAPKRQLDYILHSPDLTVKEFSVPPVTLSDHAPLVCDFELK